MNSLLKLLLIGFCLSTTIMSQSPDTSWTKLYGSFLDDAGYSVQQTTDGGYIFTGSYRYQGSSSNGYDVYLVKTNEYGDTIWTKTYGGLDNDRGNFVQQTTDGGYIVVGTTTSFGNGYSDAYLIKTDGNGELEWSKTYGGLGFDYGTSIKQTSDKGYIFTGGYTPLGSSYPDVWLVKLDSNGDSVWTKRFGGALRDIGNSVIESGDGNFLIAGETFSYGLGVNDFYVIQTNSTGDSLWTKTYGGTYSDRAYCIQETLDNNFIISGFYGTTTYDVVTYLIKISTEGDTLWTKTYEGENLQSGNYVYSTTDGGYVICGTKSTPSPSDISVIKTNSYGNIEWTKIIGDSWADEGYAIQQTTDGGYILIGSHGESVYSDVWLIKLAPVATSVNEASDNTLNNFRLNQNYPNPFNPSTKISYQIPQNGFTTLKVYDVLGKEVATLVNEERPAGSYEIHFDGASLPSGIYFYNITAGNYTETKKMILLK